MLYIKLRNASGTGRVALYSLLAFTAFGIGGFSNQAYADETTPSATTATKSAQLSPEAIASLYDRGLQKEQPAGKTLVSLEKSETKENQGEANALGKMTLLPASGRPVFLGKSGQNCGQLTPIGLISPFPINFRIGLVFSPRTLFDVGADVTLGGLKLIDQLATRVDADVIIYGNFAGISTVIPITFDQIYTKSIIAGARIYAGGGIGPYITNGDTRFGGKLFVGAGISNRVGAEFTVHFPGFGEALLALQARIGL